MRSQITGPLLPLLNDALQRAGGAPWTLAPAALPLSEFVRALERAGEQTERPGALWRCGQQLARDALHSLMPATRGARGLRQTLQLAAADMALQQTDSRFELRFEGELVTFEYRVLEPAIWPRARDAELTLGFLDGLVRRFAPRDYRPQALTFEHAPDAHGRAIASALGGPCLYRQPSNAYSLSRALLHGSPPSAGAEQQLCELRAALARRERDGDLSLRLRRAVFAMIGGEEPLEQARVAARCALSTRSLRRHLAQHGLGFRGELARLRLEYAHAALTLTDLPIEEIARRLDYSEQSALSRAVRRELGLSPSQLRAQALRERKRRAASWPD